MRAEIISVGTELLLGQIANTNAQWLGQRLAELGIPLYHVTMVGDNRERVVAVIAEAWARAELVILTGGLGPTSDDLTHAAVADFLQVPLARHALAEQAIRERFARLDRDLTPTQLKQADLPEGAGMLSNPRGTAPGCLVEQAGHLLATFPGVPEEMMGMWPQLAERLGGGQPIQSRSLVLLGIGEGRMAEQVQDLLHLDDPTVAPLAHDGYCTLRVTARAGEPLGVIREIHRRLGSFVVGEAPLEQLVAEALAETGQTVAVAESLTGGELSAALNQLPGSTERFSLGIVAYQSEAKRRLLEVSPDLLVRVGAVDGNVALEMARAARRMAGADWGLAVTGYAGPGESAGQVYGALSGPWEWVRDWQVGALGRSRVRRQTALLALRMLLEGVRVGQKGQITGAESGQATN